MPTPTEWKTRYALVFFNRCHTMWSVTMDLEHRDYIFTLEANADSALQRMRRHEKKIIENARAKPGSGWIYELGIKTIEMQARSAKPR